jgi:ferredoxin
MIITKQKNFDELLQILENGPVFLIGCSQCATLCHTGGEDEILAMKEALEKRKIPVSGYVVLDPACHLQNNTRLLKEHAKELENINKILVFTCGTGVQTVAEHFVEKKVITGTDTLFLGEISHVNEFNKRCMLCGDCLLDSFGGLCPVSRCPKSLLNGPCGGASGGKCEINTEMECIWDRIYQELKKRGNLRVLSVIQQPKDWSKAGELKRRI